MVASAVLGAATGTGLALLVAMTLVVYRYYSSRRYSKDWGDAERFTAGSTWTKSASLTGGTSSGLKKGSGRLRPYPFPAPKILNVSKEETTVQPSSPPVTDSMAPPLEVTGGLQAHLCRTPSLSSHHSIDSATSRLSGPHRTLSPDCRTMEGLRSCRSLSPLLLPQDSTSSLTTICSRDGPTSPLPLGTIQPSLYTRPEGPLILRSDSGHSAGRIHFSARYDYDRSDLHVHLIEGEDLAGGEFTEPYVRVSLEPAVDNRVRQISLPKSPVSTLNHHFKFPVCQEDLQYHTLVLQVFDYDRYSRNDVIGELRLDLSRVDTTSPVEVWADIEKTKKPPEDLQEVLVSLSYLPSAERLTVCLLKARNLYLPEGRDSIDPFVKVYLLANGKRIKKKKTAARKSCSNPVWNEALTFNISPTNLACSSIEVCVMDQGSEILGVPATGPTLVGSVRLGDPSPMTTSDSSKLPPQTPQELHWQQMASNPRKTIAMWHPVR